MTCKNVKQIKRTKIGEDESVSYCMNKRNSSIRIFFLLYHKRKILVDLIEKQRSVQKCAQYCNCCRQLSRYHCCYRYIQQAEQIQNKLECSMRTNTPSICPKRAVSRYYTNFHVLQRQKKDATHIFKSHNTKIDRTFRNEVVDIATKLRH